MGFGPSRCSFAPLLGAQTSRTVAQTLCVDVARSVDSEQRRDDLLDKAVPAILCAIRETDIAGWHQEHSALEVIFAELGATDQTSTLAALRAKATGILLSVLRPDEICIYASPSTVSRTSGARITLGFRSRSSIRILCSATSRARYPGRSSASRMCWGVRWR